MTIREKLKIQLIENRLMRNFEETEQFEEAMNKLYSEENLENIPFYCEAFDDDTEHREVMFGMIHGIENYDNIFSSEVVMKKLIDSVFYFNNNSNDWQEIIFLRIVNDENSRNILTSILKINPNNEIINKVILILKRIINRDKNKFQNNVNEIFNRINFKDFPDDDKPKGGWSVFD
jgi:hypothetical protein